MNRSGSGLGRADLLRALAVAASDPGTHNQLAQALDFFERALAADLIVFKQTSLVATATASATVTATLTTQPARKPLKAPLFGIVRAEPIAQEKRAVRPELTQLQSADYLPRSGARLHFQALLGRPTLVRRARETLAEQHAGRVLDVPRAVDYLARARLPARWPRRVWPQAPERVTVLVDRSQHLRPYWDDQDQLVFALYQWLGAAGLSTYTVQGDPWTPLACWTGGQAHTRPLPLAPQPAGSVVLLLTDMGCLRDGVARFTGVARWEQCIRHLGRNGARVLACPPCSAARLPRGWPARLAWLPLRKSPAQKVAPAQATRIPRDMADDAALQQLLTLLACARRIEPELVRALRRLDPALAAEPGLEAQLWSNFAAMDAGSDVCVWQPGAASGYRAKFEGLASGLQQAVLRVMLEVHAVRGRAIEAQEILAWASHVDAPTAEPFTEKIEEARQWMERLPIGHVHGGATDANLVAFAQQTQAAQGADDALVKAFPHAFGPLWGITHAVAEAQGRPLPAPGVLPPEMLPLWRKPLQSDEPVRTYHLEQVNDKLLLKTHARERLHAWSPLGQPLALTSITLTTQPGDQHRFSYPQTDEVELLRVQPDSRCSLRTDAVQLQLEEIVAPCETLERGRDRHGLYVDVAVQPPRAAAQRVRLRWIEPGQFLMGSPPSEAERFEDEGPQHLVTIRNGFWLADTACTQTLWQAVMGENPSHFQAKNQDGPEHPVENVSWHMAQEFLTKLQTLLPGCRATLPTEAEWEYACRAGTTTPFSLGDTITTEQVNYDGIHPYGEGKKGEYRECTVAVKDLSANAWGLYQMHGNVWEWCADQTRLYTEDAQTDPGLGEALDLQAGDKEAPRALRGGSWIVRARIARCANRNHDQPHWLDYITGFRFALRATSPASAPQALRPQGGSARRDGAGFAAGSSGRLPPQAASRDATAAPGTGAGAGRLSKILKGVLGKGNKK